ncbi:MAG: hypothetical protein R2752_07655 [Vicinamibacterales bacterium]
MTRRAAALAAGLVAAIALAGLAPVVRAAPPAGRRPARRRVASHAGRAVADPLPDRLTDEAFWALSQELSEADGEFRSDNLVSNEIWFQYTLDDLLARSRKGAVYLGVGPEQNFTYIAALEPRMVFITDIRRGNLHTQLMYKALFELSNDRAEFVSRLFTKPRPASLTRDSSAQEIFDAYAQVDTSGEAAFKQNSQDILDLLTKTHHIPLSERDQRAIIDNVYYYFYWYGPPLTYNSSSGRGFGRSNMASYYDLMTATDQRGAARSFLASDAAFRTLKRLEERNLVVPVVGNFAGPKALRSVGRYIRDHGSTVSAFYLSNVEQYLNQQGVWRAFCANVATMPLDERSTFIRSSQNRSFGGGGGGLVNSLGGMAAETKGCGPSVPVGGPGSPPGR